MNTMSAAEYRRLIINPARENDLSDDEYLKLMRGEKKNASNPGKKKKEVYQVRTGVAVFEGGKKVDEINGEWQPVKKVRNHEEDDLTKQVAEYCELLMAQGKVTAFSHIPASTFTKSWAVKNKNAAMGVRAGVPDMLIVFPTKVLFLELKRLKGGVVSEAQKCWIDALSATGKVTAVVAAGWDQAKQAIDSLLE